MGGAIFDSQKYKISQMEILLTITHLCLLGRGDWGGMLPVLENTLLKN